VSLCCFSKCRFTDISSPAFQLLASNAILGGFIGFDDGGNIMALRQVNVKRILAFSGISHAGFMLTLLNTTNTAGTLLYYTSAYALAGIAAFSVIIYVLQRQ
jgi:formate hydrogenlyase subunit 3/multisubunit Na+/H+ antiporter MnhD subunit